MTIQNYVNTDGEKKQLYEVRYDGTIACTEKDARVHLLATGLDDAIEMFCGFYKTTVPNPKEIPSTDELTEYDVRVGRRAITGIEKIMNAVLIRTEQPVRK
ncbi:hypothetical protein GF336_05115 [Candidatus Woesearchaeota archaeon]|nr:hypothetical protein [Candidatus Woesearchaeota archaeon]